MDAHVKDGQLYVQHQKFGKKWKKNWFVLYPASPNGIARLECYDSPTGSGGGSGGGAGGGANEKTRKLDKKIIRLSECISILPAAMEPCPKENMAAFCVETNDKTHVFAAERAVSMEWVEKMCEIAFQGGSTSSSSSIGAVDSNGGTRELQMSENLIYSSREEVNEFWVSVQPTEASGRCGLAGSYWLKADREALVLKDPQTRRGVLLWPYKLLRRYGRDRVMFSFEAGRRCESGPGKFTFDTKQGNDIFLLVEQAIQSQKERAPDPEGPCSLAPPRGPAAAPGPGGDSSGGGGGSSRESDGDSGGSKPGSGDGVLGRRDDGGGAKACGGGNKGRSLPEPPAPVRGPMAGPRLVLNCGGKGAVPHFPGAAAASPGCCSSSSSSSSTSLDDPGSLYSEPADSLRLPPPPPRADGLYSDPVDLMMGQTPPPAGPTPLPRQRPLVVVAPAPAEEAPPPGDVYSYLFDKMNLELSHKAGGLALEEGAAGRGAAGGAGGRGRRPSGGRYEGSSSSTSSSSSSSHPAHPAEHIYDEPEGCARGGRRGGGDPAGAASVGPSQWPKAPGPKPSKLKPFLAPKPPHLNEPLPLPPPPLRPREPFTGKNLNNNNHNNNHHNNIGGSASRSGSISGSISVSDSGNDLYSKVSKQRPPSPGLWFGQHTPTPRPQHHQPPLRTPDLIYDNLGDL